MHQLTILFLRYFYFYWQQLLYTYCGQSKIQVTFPFDEFSFGRLRDWSPLPATQWCEISNLEFKEEIDAAVQRLSATSERLIRTQLAEHIDATIGSDVVSILGTKLATQLDEANQLSLLKQDASDKFVQMRNRALQYAEAARRQATYFRWLGIFLALGGLTILGIVLYRNQQQFLDDPKLIERHVEWPMFLLRHGPSYAFVALCEFLALIMFRYQSKALEYMRYFSNEGTNVDARHIAFVSALRFMDKATLGKLIERIEATERNFLINKDQRTLELANNENEDRLFERIRKVMSVARQNRDGDEEHPAKGKRRTKAAT